METTGISEKTLCPRRSWLSLAQAGPEDEVFAGLLLTSSGSSAELHPPRGELTRPLRNGCSQRLPAALPKPHWLTPLHSAPFTPPRLSPGNFPGIPKTEFPAGRERVQIKGMRRTRRSHGALELQIPPLLPPEPLSLSLFAAMRLLSSHAARIPGPSGSLCLLLALLLLTPPGPLASGESSQPVGRTGQAEWPRLPGGRGAPGVGKCPGRTGWGRDLPATCPYPCLSFYPSGSCRGHSERAALHVLNHHTGDSSQNGQ